MPVVYASQRRMFQAICVGVCMATELDGPASVCHSSQLLHRASISRVIAALSWVLQLSKMHQAAP